MDRTAQKIVAPIVPIAIIVSIAAFVLSGFTVGNLTKLITPIEFARVIWIPIFFGMLAFSYVQLFRKNRIELDLSPLRWWVIIAVTLSILRIQTTSLVPVAIYDLIVVTTLGVALYAASLVKPKGFGALYDWAVSAPINLFAGWMTIAAVVSLSRSHNLPGTSELGGALILAFGIAIAAAAIWRLPDPRTYVVGAGWGLFGILLVNGITLSIIDIMIVIALCGLVILYFIVDHPQSNKVSKFIVKASNSLKIK